MTLIPQADVDDFKARTDIVEVISRYLELKKQGKVYAAHCPFHGKDDTPSLYVDPVKKVWNCLGGCQANGDAGGGKGKSGGDVFAFVMKIENVDFRAAARILGMTVKDENPPPRRNGHNGHQGPIAAVVKIAKAHESRAQRTAYLSSAVEHWHQELAINRRAQEYLEQRGLLTKALWKSYRLGYSSGSIEELAGERESPAWKALRELDVLNDDGKERMKGRLIYPLTALNQLVVGFYGRSVGDDLRPHHMRPTGPLAGLFNWNAARRASEILLVESFLCAHSLVEARLVNVVPLGGSSAIPVEMWDLFGRFGVTKVVLGLDADETGRKQAPLLAEKLRQKGLKVRTIEWPEKDPNTILMGYGVKKLREIAEKLLLAPKACDVTDVADAAAHVPASAPAIAPASASAPGAATVSEAAFPLPDASSSRDAPSSPVAEDAAAGKRSSDASRETTPTPMTTTSPATSCASASGAGGALPAAEASASAAPAPVRPAPAELLADRLTLSLDDRLWDVTWQSGPDGQLRAHVKIFMGVSETPAFLDVFNLRSSRAREGFTKKAAALALPLDAPSRDVTRLVRLLDADLLRIAELGEERRRAAEATSDKRLETMTDERRRRAMAYAKAPRLLVRVVEDIGASGYVGEPTTKALGYLVSTSRKLPEALSMVILSSSGSGKSALADVLEKLTPEEDLVVVTRFTASSLYWMPRDALKRKFVSIEERAGSFEADYSIRALQSKKKVTMMAPIKDQASGKLETKFFEVEGPASFLESTTESRIDHENATRCFEVRLDESREQTRRIQDAQRFAKTLEGHKAKRRADEIAALHQDVQRILHPVRVVIPYASAIEFPAESIRTRRDNPRFLDLIEALAFLHQYQRPLTVFETGLPSERPLEKIPEDELDTVRVEATLDDYAMAYELASDLLYETLAELKRPLRELLAVIRTLAEEEAKRRGVNGAKPSDIPLLQRQIRERAPGLERHTVRRHLAELVELEYVSVTRGVSGGSYVYRIVDLPEKQGGRIPGLLLPEELARKLQPPKKEVPS